MNDQRGCQEALDLSLRDLEAAITAVRTQIYLSKQSNQQPLPGVPLGLEKPETVVPSLSEFTATESLTRYIVDLMRVLISCYPIYGPALQHKVIELWEELT